MTLSASELCKRYHRPTAGASFFVAVESASLELSPGKITEITGRSGSGKSTLLYMMSGLLVPSSGSVRLDGTDLYSLSDGELSDLRNRSFGMILQGHTGLSALTVLQNVVLPAMISGDSSCAQPRAMELLEALGIAHLSDARVSELSGGELRRLSVARSLVMEPSVVFADEPTDDLDDGNTMAVLSLLRSYADGGASVLLVTHEAKAADFADSIYRMDAGKLEEQ